MPLREDLRGVIQKAKEDKEKHEKETRDFESTWYKLRESLISPLFREAAKAFRDEGIGTYQENRNGSAVLHAGNADEDSNEYRHRLVFRADPKRRVVECSSDLFADESFTLDHLDEKVIHEKLKMFADLVARGNSPRP